MNSSNFKDSLPFGNSKTDGVLELVIYWFVTPLVSRLLALPLIYAAPCFFIFALMPGLLSSLGCDSSALLDLPSLLELPTWLLLAPPIPLSLMDIGRDPSFFTPFWSAFWAWYRWLCLRGLRLLFILDSLKLGLLFNVVNWVGRSCSMLLPYRAFELLLWLFCAFPPLIYFLWGLNLLAAVFSIPFYWPLWWLYLDPYIPLSIFLVPLEYSEELIP